MTFLDHDPSAMGQSYLPVELIVRILSFLPFKDIVICSGVSRQFRHIIDTSSVLEYILELGLCGLIDSAQGNFTTSERLFRLRQREAAWSALDWEPQWKIPVNQKYIFWELIGGLFAGTYMKTPTSNPYPSFHIRRAFDMLDIFKFGSGAAAGLRRMALHQMFYDFAIDPGQDLLILLEVPPFIHTVWKLHICSLSSGFVHPRATKPIIEIPVAYEDWPYNGRCLEPTEIQILGRTVLFSQRRGPGLSGSLSVIDWTTSARIYQINPVLGDWCGTLLSETEVLIAQRSSFRSPPALELYQLHSLSKGMARHVRFMLPFPERFHDWQSVYCYSPASLSTTGDSPARSDNIPFTFPPTPHLLAFRFKPTYRVDRPLDMFLLVDQFRKYMHIDDEVPWEVWGPDTTRIFKATLPSQWRRNIHGLRALIPHCNNVLDFNSNLWTAGDPGVVTQSSHISIKSAHGHAFNIVSSLPYREMIPPEPFGGHNVILSDDIVRIEMDGTDKSKIKSLQVLSF